MRVRGTLICAVGLLTLAACGNDEDVGGSSDSQTTKQPTSDTSSTTDTPTTGATDSDTVLPTTTTDEPQTTGTTDATTTDMPPDPLTVDCGAPPSGAKAAKYSHQPSAAGGTPSYTWSATGLPAGLTIDPGSGEISGASQEVGDFAFELTVMDSGGMSAMTTCPGVNFNDQLGVDLDAIDGPCLVAGESLLDYISGGDGTPIEDDVLDHLRACYDAETIKNRICDRNRLPGCDATLSGVKGREASSSSGPE